MGPEIIAAIVGPLLGGVVSVIIWIGKKNADKIDNGFIRLNSNVEIITKNLSDIKLDIAKNYTTRDDLLDHMREEEGLREVTNEHLKQIRQDIKDLSQKSDQEITQIKNDIGQIKEYQWRSRMEIDSMKTNIEVDRHSDP